VNEPTSDVVTEEFGDAGLVCSVTAPLDGDSASDPRGDV
jgi:hypothetical protein